MAICKICEREFNSINGLSKHLYNQHKIEKEDYYNKHIGIMSSICKCGNKKIFRNLGEGYREYCSIKCRSNYLQPNSPWKGKKQPKEMIEKRRNTIFERYGVSNGYLTNTSKTEKYKGFVCRSKYEKMFVDFAEEYNYTLSIPERIQYEFQGTERYFYPDFNIDELDLIVEIKSDWTWNLQLDMNIAKILSAIQQGYDIIFIDEEHGLTNKETWSELNEYLLFG